MSWTSSSWANCLLNSLFIGYCDLTSNSRSLWLDNFCRLFTPLSRVVRISACSDSHSLLMLSWLSDTILVWLLLDSFDWARCSYHTLSVSIRILNFAWLVWHYLHVDLLLQQSGWHGGLSSNHSGSFISCRMSFHNSLFAAATSLRSRSLSDVLGRALFGATSIVSRDDELVFLSAWLR